MKRKTKKIEITNKIDLKDWKKLIIKKSEIKTKTDSQKVFQQMRYGKPVYC